MSDNEWLAWFTGPKWFRFGFSESRNAFGRKGYVFSAVACNKLTLRVEYKL